jgi:hypothetical protein
MAALDVYCNFNETTYWEEVLNFDSINSACANSAISSWGGGQQFTYMTMNISIAFMDLSRETLLDDPAAQEALRSSVSLYIEGTCSRSETVAVTVLPVDL